MGSYRWLLLLRALKYNIGWLHAFKLQLTGFFFNTVMPGAVGGDLVKVMYVIRDNKELGKTPALMSVFIDRLLGMLGLFLIGTFTALFNVKLLLSDPTLQAIFILTIAITTAIITFFAAALYHYKDDKDPWLSILNK